MNKPQHRHVNTCNVKIYTMHTKGLNENMFLNIGTIYICFLRNATPVMNNITNLQVSKQCITYICFFIILNNSHLSFLLQQWSSSVALLSSLKVLVIFDPPMSWERNYANQDFLSRMILWKESIGIVKSLFCCVEQAVDVLPWPTVIIHKTMQNRQQVKQRVTGTLYTYIQSSTGNTRKYIFL